MILQMLGYEVCMRLPVLSMVGIFAGCGPDSPDNVATVHAALAWESEAMAEFREYTPDDDPPPDQSFSRPEPQSTVEQFRTVLDRFSSESAAFREAMARMSSRIGRGPRARIEVELPLPNDVCRHTGIDPAGEKRVAKVPATTPRSEALLVERLRALAEHDQEPADEP